MKAKIIKTETDYQDALAYIDTLMDAAPGSPEEEELELFATLVENYENENFPIELPDPIAAIKFRMEQQGLTRKDLIPYLGSQSKVSEVLNGKIPLSISMIRALHTGLGIPAEVLLKEPGKRLETPIYNWRDFPFNEMFKMGYFPSFKGTLQDAKQYSEELLLALFANLPGRASEPVYCRRSEGQMDQLALTAWQARVIELASQQKLPVYEKTRLSEDVLREIVKLSKFESGPTLAKELLHQLGIALVVLAHLPQTYLDGACFKSLAGHPIIGLTLRHDRLDNFWFTLLHELAHVYLHLDQDNFAFFDETEGGIQGSNNPQELEADKMSVRMLIPEEIWNQEGRRIVSKREIEEFSIRHGISPAIPAGRLRWQSQNFNTFSELLGNHTVRKLFPTAS